MAEFRWQQLTIVVLAQNHNPTILNPDFLWRNEIVPTDWKVAGSPLCTDPVAQVSFESGVTLTAHLDRLMFAESNSESLAESPVVPSIAISYLKALPHVAYKAVGVNPQGLVAFAQPQKAERFAIEHLVRAELWQDLRPRLSRAAVSLTFDLDESRLAVSMQPTTLEGEDGSAIQVAGNFHHEPDEEDHDERNTKILHSIGRWQDHVRFFRERIVDCLLQED
jgi:hypothetical protein